MALFGGVEIVGKPDLENVRKLDRLAIPLIRRAHRLGIAIDRPYFEQELYERFSTQIAELEKDIESYIPVDKLNEFADRAADIEENEGAAAFNAGSSEQIAHLLFDLLDIGSDLIEEGKLKRTAKGNVSTGKKQLELIKHKHPVVPKIQRHRELKKLLTTYVIKLPKMSVWHPSGPDCPICELSHEDGTWRIHGEMGTTRAETGRINHKNPNLGNIPTRTEDGRAVQAGFIAGKGKKFIKTDLSQIELRCLAHLSCCSSMLKVYDEGGDLHDDTVWRAGLCPWGEKPDKYKHRMAAKRVNFGIQNGTTEKGLYLQLVMDFGAAGVPIPEWLTEAWCKKFIEDSLNARPEVREYFEQCWYRARRYQLSWDIFGRCREIPEVRSTHRWIKDAGLRNAQNLPVTSTAAGQLKLSMGKVDEALRQLLESGVWCWPLLTIHDAILTEAEEDYAEDVSEVQTVCMNSCMDDETTGEHRFRTPILSDGDVMERWK